MYAFLSKVFGRKKDDKDASSSSQPVLGPGELLGGRFEAVSRSISPIPQFSELDPKTQEAKDKEVENDAGFSFFKGKWRPASPDVKPSRKLDVLPHLSLNFQEPKAVSATPDMGLLFRTDQILSDAVIGQRRLNPLEALVLVQACSQAIIAKGLDTLGVMHPHWYAASHDIQRRVISHFIYLLNLESATPIASPVSPTSPLSAFEAEVNDTFSPHDIAAILRWGLRHVQLDGDSLGTDGGWYKTFLEAEGTAGYPPKAFSDKLAPLLPTAHLQLLTATLEIFSSLAAHAECNGTSGSKLCKIFGLWLLTAHRVEDKDDWQTFYAKWERTGRMLEHLFLSRIRDESTDQRMPVRLLELVRKYPYTKGLSSPTTDLPLLPRPPFTTCSHDAFFVRIEIELPYGKSKPSSKLHPLLLLSDAFSTKVEEGEYADLWTKITSASKGGDSSSLSNIFTDDTIRFLSLVPDEPIGHEVRSPTFSVVSPVSPHKRSFSVDDADKSEAIVAGHPKSATEFSPMTLLSPLNNGIGSDWAQFSASGFLEVSPGIIPLASTLLDTDIEKTIPPEPVTPLSRKSSKRSKAASPSSPRKSVDLARFGGETSPEARPEDIEEQRNVIKASQLEIVQLDEAFIDFWADSLLDPISADWPKFILCKFKSSLVPELTFGVAEEGQKQKTIQWLVLEQVYTIRKPPVPSIPVDTVRQRPSSPGGQSTSGRKRFSFWSVSRTASSSSGASYKGKKKDQELRVGEMGELHEEEHKNESKEPTLKIKSPIFRSRKSLDIARKPAEPMKKSVIKAAEGAKIDEETAVVAAVAAVATGVGVVSTAAAIANGLPTDPSLAEAVTANATSVAGNEGQIVAPVDVRSESAALVETSRTDELVEVILPPKVKESPETLAPMVEPSYESPNDETVGSHISPKVDAVVPKSQVLSEEEPAAPIELSLERVADLSVPSQELPVAAEPEQPATHEEATVSIPVETEPEPPSVNSASEDTHDVKAQHVLLSSKSRDAPGIESKDEIILPATAEPGPEVVEAVVAPVSEILEPQPQLSVEETTEEVRAVVEAPSAIEVEAIIPNEGRSVLAMETPIDGQLESTVTTIPIVSSLDDVPAFEVKPEQVEGHTTVAVSSEPLYEPLSTPKNGLIPTAEDDISVEPVKTQFEALSLPVAEESDCTAGVEPQIIPATTEESPAQIDEERPILATLQDDTTLSEAVNAEPLEAVLIGEEPTIVESELDPLHLATSIPAVPTPASDIDVVVTAQPSEVLEDELDTAGILPEPELDRPGHDLKTEGSSSIGEGAVQDSSASTSSVDVDTNPNHETIPNANLGADVRTLVVPEFHGTPAAAELGTATSVAPDTPRVSAIPDSTDTSDPATETVQLPLTVSHELPTITNESTLALAEGTLDVQPETQVLKDTSNDVTVDTDVAEVDILPETVPSMVIDDTKNLTVSSTPIVSSESHTEHVNVAEETKSVQNGEPLPATEETPMAVQASTVESIEESVTRPQPESEMVVLPSADNDKQDTTLNEFGVTAEEIRPSDTELDFTTDVTPSTSSTEETEATASNRPFSDVSFSRQAQESEVVTDSLEQPMLLSMPAPIDLAPSSGGLTTLAAEDIMRDSQVGATDPTTILSPSAKEGDPIGEIPVVTNAISNESVAPAPLFDELQQFEASADLQDSDVIVTDDTQNKSMNSTVKSAVVPSHEPVAEGNSIAESTEVEGALTDMDAPINTAIPTLVGERIIADFEDVPLTSDDISNPEAGLPLSDRSSLPVDNEPIAQDNTSITPVEMDTGITRVDEMLHEVVKDKKASAELEPSIVVSSAAAVEPTSELSTSLGGASETIEHSYPLNPPLDAEPISLSCQQAPTDVADEHERSTMESHREADYFVQSPEPTNPASKEESQVETAAADSSSIQDKLVTEAKVDSIEELNTEAANIDQGNALSTQTEDLFDREGNETVPTMEHVKGDAQIETIDHAVQETVVSEEANAEESLATVEDFTGHSDFNTLSVEPSAGFQPIEERSVDETTISNAELPAEVIQAPSSLKVDEVTLEPQDDAAVPTTTTDELSISESPVIDNPIEGPRGELEAKDIASDRPEDLSQTDVIATDETVPTRDCEAIGEPSEILLEVPEEQSEGLDRTGSSILTSSSSAAETETRQTNVSTEPLEETNRSVETPDFEGISETQPQVDLTDVQVLPEAKDNLIQVFEEPVDSHVEVEESVEIFSTTESSVAEPAPAVSESATAVPEDLQIENGGITQAEEGSVDPPPTDNTIREDVVASLEAVEISSTAEPSVAETTSAFSEPATQVPEDLQIENGGITHAEEDSVDLHPPTDDAVQEGAVAPLVESKEVIAQPLVAETTLVVSEPATAAPEELQIENDGIARAEEFFVDSPPTNNIVQEEAVTPLLESKEAVGVSSTAEPSMAETVSDIISEPATVVPQDLQIENGGIAQAEEHSVDPPTPTHDPVQEHDIAPLVESKEVIAEPSVAETTSISEPATAAPEELHIENGGIAQAEERLVDPTAPTDDPVEEDAVAPLVDSKEVMAEPSVAETTSVVSEQATVVPEELQIENGGIAQAEEAFVDPPLLTDVQEVAVAPLVESKETIAEPSVAETATVVSEPATVVPEELQIENGGTAQAEEDSADPPLLTDVQEAVIPIVESKEAIEISSTAEPSASEIASVVSEPPTKVPQIENDGIAQAEEHFVDSPAPTDGPVQENAVAPLVESKEVMAEPPVAETASVVSEPATAVSEELQVENGGIAEAEEESVDPVLPPTANPVQEDAVTPFVESKEAISSAAEPAAVDSEGIQNISEPTIVVHELQIENDGIVQAEEDLVDSPPPVDNPIQEESVAPLVDFKGAVEVSSTAELSVVEPLSVVISEQATILPVDLQVTGGIAQAEEDFVGPPTDSTVQEDTVAPLVESDEAVEMSPIAQTSVAETVSVISEPATVVPEDLQIENGDIAQAGLVDPPLPTDDPVQEEVVAPLVEFKEAVEISSTGEPSVAETASAVSEPTVVPEDLQTENGDIAQADLVDPLPPTDEAEAVAPLVEFQEAVHISSTAEPSAAEIASAISEPATVLLEDLHIEDGGIAHAEEDFVDPPPPAEVSVQEEALAPIVESEAVEISSIAEPSTSEIASVVSEPSTEVPEDLQIVNGGITQAEEHFVDPPAPTDEPVHEDTVIPIVESKAVEISSTAEPSVAETAVSEPTTDVPEDPQIENGGIAQAEEGLVDPPPLPAADSVQEDAIASLVEYKEATVEPSVVETVSVISEPATVVPEELQIEGGIAQAEEESVDPPLPPTDDPIPEDGIITIVESKEAISSTAEPSVAEAASLVSEPTTVVPEHLQIENGGIAQAEEDLVDPPPTDNPVQAEAVAPVETKEAVEISSTTEPSVAEIASIISEPSTEVPQLLSIDTASNAQENHPVDLPPLRTVGTEPIGEGTEDQVQAAIPETIAVEDTVVEKQSFEQTAVGAPETHVLDGNGHSATREETIGILDDATSENFATEDDIIKAEPKVVKPIHHLDISPDAIETPSTTH